MSNIQTYTLPADLATAVQASLAEWQAGDKTRRLWAKDASIWTGADESRWLDWLQIVADALALPVTASEVKEASLRGAAVVTLERLGRVAGAAPLGGTFEPRADRAAAYVAARERQRELYRAAIGADTS